MTWHFFFIFDLNKELFIFVIVVISCSFKKRLNISCRVFHEKFMVRNYEHI